MVEVDVASQTKIYFGKPGACTWSVSVDAIYLLLPGSAELAKKTGALVCPDPDSRMPEGAHIFMQGDVWF